MGDLICKVVAHHNMPFASELLIQSFLSHLDANAGGPVDCKVRVSEIEGSLRIC